MRRQYQFLNPNGNELTQVLTLYGDADDQTRAALLTMLCESLAIAEAEIGTAEVKIRLRRIP